MAGNNDNSFSVFLDKCLCPYAETAKHWFADVWSENIDYENGITRLCNSLDLFVTTGVANGYDIFVVQLVAPNIVNDIFELSSFFNQLLIDIRNRDNSCQEPLSKGIESIEWDFTYSGIRFFIPVFAPFYPISHARQSFVKDTAFILFQHDLAFSWRGIHKSNPNRSKLSENVRNLFVKGGRPYDASLIDGTPKAIRYIKPINIGDTPITWWRLDK